MAWLRSLVRSFTQRGMESPSFNFNDPNAWEMLGSVASDSGVRINQRTALTYAAFWRGVNLISRDIGKLPVYVYRRSDNGVGKSKDTTHPAYKLLLHRPNEFMTAIVFKQTLIAHVLMRGNGYAYIVRNGAGEPVELLPLLPDRTFPVRVDGKLWYLTTITLGSGQGQPVEMLQRKLPAEDVIHWKGLGFDGLEGFDVITFARDSLGLGLAAHKFGALVFANAAEPACVIEHPNRLTPKAAANLRESWANVHAGIDRAHRVAILEEGMKIHPYSFSAKQAQLLEMREFELLDVANWLHLPPHKVGHPHRTAFASQEQSQQDYLDEALDPWLVGFEEEGREKLLTEAEKRADSHVIKFDRKELLRADLAGRSSYYVSGLTNGWLSDDDVREMEGLNPIPGGKGADYRVPSNLQVLGATPPAPPAPASALPAPTPATPPEPPAPAVRSDTPFFPFGRTEEAIVAVLDEAGRRMIRRIGHHARDAAKNPKKFMEWLDAFQGDHRQAVIDALRPGAEAMAAFRQTDIAVEEMTAGLLDELRSGLLETSGKCTAAQLETGVVEYVAELERRYSDDQPRDQGGRWTSGGGGDAAKETKAAIASGHQATIEGIMAKVKDAGSKRGGLGAKGLKEIAKSIGVKGASGMKKAAVVASIQEKLSAAHQAGPAKDLADRLDRLQLAEKGTGIKFTDRVVNGMIAQTPVVNSPTYKTALADLAKNGPNAKAEHISYMKVQRENVLRDLKEGGGHPETIKDVLNGIAESGHGRLSPEELRSHLAGEKITAASGNRPDQGIIPHDLKIAPGPRTSGRKESSVKGEPDYIDRLRAPASDRMDHIKEREKQSGIPFEGRVVHDIIGDQKFEAPGKANYTALSNKQEAGGRLSENEKKQMQSFYKSVVSKMKYGDVSHERIVHALERVDNAGHGTMKINEFLATLNMRKAA